MAYAARIGGSDVVCVLLTSSAPPPPPSPPTGFKDDNFIALHLRTTLLKNTATKEAGLNYEDFLRALMMLNAPCSPGAATVLFARYDVSGSGHVDATRFAHTLLDLVPSAHKSPALRSAQSIVSEHLSKRGGAHALRALHAALFEAACGRDIVSINIARRVLAAAVGSEARGHIEILLHEASVTLAHQAVSARALTEMMRSSLTRRTRAVLDVVWAEAEAGARNTKTTVTVAALAVAPSKSISLAGGLIARDFYDVWGTPSSSHRDVVTYAEWVDYGRDLRTAAGSDDAFVGVLSSAWGANAHYDADEERAPPGSPTGTLRARRAAAMQFEATTGLRAEQSKMPRKGAPPGPASEATGVPVILSQPLGRYFAATAYEPMFGRGSAIPVPNGTLISGIGSSGWAAMSRPAGTSFLHGTSLAVGNMMGSLRPGSTFGGSVTSPRGTATMAETYAKVRHHKMQTGYMQNN